MSQSGHELSSYEHHCGKCDTCLKAHLSPKDVLTAQKKNQQAEENEPRNGMKQENNN